ncbi:hypothetical protein V6N12_055652, partial [Hibiscus sabdariffa]
GTLVFRRRCDSINSSFPKCSFILDNIDLFCHVRNNITAMLNNMRDTPGLMSHMPPLPVSANEDLAKSILPGATNTLPQTVIFGLPSGIHLKQEPRC